MTMFADRERAFEAKFARDAELKFRIMARRDRLFGLWSAEMLGKTPEQARDYVADILKSDFAGDDANSEARIGIDLAGRVTPEAVHQKFIELTAIARAQIIEEMN